MRLEPLFDMRRQESTISSLDQGGLASINAVHMHIPVVPVDAHMRFTSTACFGILDKPEAAEISLEWKCQSIILL